MLTSQQALAHFDYATGRVYPDRLSRVRHQEYLEIAERLLEIYRSGIGQTRQLLHQRVEEVFKELDDCPQRRISALIKLLEDRCQYGTDGKRQAAKLRLAVFQAAAPHHPLSERSPGIFGSQQIEVKRQIARDWKMSWPELERKLFCDVMEFHTLESFEGYSDGMELLARYNVAQVQAGLYRAVRMTLWARSDLKAIIRLVKLSRLMHTITRGPDGTYRFSLNGPASALRATRRYGVSMAKMIPGLLACRDWKMNALIPVGKSGRQLALQLTSQDGLTSPSQATDEFDSEVEADLMQKWNEVSLPAWKLTRESELLVHAQKVFTPDFVATHETGRQVFMEIVGYWTPEYLKSKVETLKCFSEHRILVIAQEEARPTLSQLPLETQESIVWYKSNRIPIQQVLEALQSP